MCDFIRLDHHSTKFSQNMSDFGFSRTYTAGQADDEHAYSNMQKWLTG